ncbi:MAG: SatD family protein [Zhongshania sp.]|uniref:SatD family protein n=1 Tax=Zhongshania sp. TaxID=1971902 RepID=UPI0026326A1B|nr:SatD family protein [Zhongshania sp.]MDF1691429.1 SatD family protein [Zhongshania sp.]
MSYIALIGDIVASKSLSDRAAVQRRLTRCCAALNSRADGLGIISPFTVTLGDEFQALFVAAKDIWPCIAEIEAEMYPVQIRFALGLGDIATDINREAALAMDGPAFHRARAGIETMKKDKVRYRLLGLHRGEGLVRHSLDMLSHNRDKWQQNRHRILSALLQQQSINDIATKLGVSEQAVYRNIRDGDLESVIGLMHEIGVLMTESLEQANEH